MACTSSALSALLPHASLCSLPSVSLSSFSLPLTLPTSVPTTCPSSHMSRCLCAQGQQEESLRRGFRRSQPGLPRALDSPAQRQAQAPPSSSGHGLTT